MGSTRSPWIAFLLRRFLALALILVGLLFATFVMVRLVPGDPATLLLGEDATPKRVADLRARLGLDKPLIEQFATYSWNLAHGDAGTSLALARQPVGPAIAQRAAVSIQLAAITLAAVLVTSIALGMAVSAFTREGRHRRFEVVFTAVSSGFGGIPEYLMATFLAFIFGLWLRVLPVGGDSGPQSLVLPVLALGLRPTLLLARILRVETLNVLMTDYIRTARSKQIPGLTLYLRHVLPNVLTSTLIIGGQLFSGIIGGAVVVENIFNRPGLGTAIVAAVRNLDYPTIQAGVLVIGVTVVVANAIADLAAAAVDPRSLSREA